MKLSARTSPSWRFAVSTGAMTASRPARIEGYAIISVDGMLADSSGVMPDSLKIDADQYFFHGSLDKADAVVHGRHSHEGGPNAPKRARLIVTRRIAGVGPHPDNPKAVLWNPAGASFAEAWTMLGIDGVLAVIGGTEVFGLFLDIGYDAFHLTRADHVRLPGGRPVFPQVPAITPENLLISRGYKEGASRLLDVEKAVRLVTWIPI